MADFKGVEDTLFIPLEGRIYSSKHFKDFFYDEKALELEKYIPSSSIKDNSNEYFMVASLARYYTFDKVAKAFIKSHEDCNIVLLGCGLETMYFRIKPTNTTFYEIDMPSVIEQRRTVLGENENEILIGSDINDYSWMDKVDKNKPTLMILSGVFQYFHKEQVLSLINEIKKRFLTVEMAFDATNKPGIKGANSYVKKTGNAEAKMYFYVTSAKKFAKEANSILIGDYPFYKDSNKKLKGKIKTLTRITCFFGDLFGFTRIVHIKIK